MRHWCVIALLVRYLGIAGVTWELSASLLVRYLGIECVIGALPGIGGALPGN